MNVDLLRTLASAAGAPLLDDATRSYGVEDEFALSRRLRRDHPPELVAAALTQARLRQRATEKFDAADACRMFFTADGYEQATRAVVANHRAARVAGCLGGAEGPRARVLDLCTGIGGDLIALARAGLDVTGVEADELTAEVARLNIDALGLGDRARVTNADATAADRSGYPAVFCDPARRTARGRVFDPDAYQPPWPFVEDLLGETACVKVAPGIPHGRVPDDVEAEWVSDRGEVKEATLWSGDLARHDPREENRRRVRRRATLLRTDDDPPGGMESSASAGARDCASAYGGAEVRTARAHTLTDVDDPGGADVHAPGRYVYEPDRAVIRAGLVTAVAEIIGGWLLDPSIAYLGGNVRVDTPFARGYEVVDTLAYDVKRLRRYVREHGIGILTIKKRGVGITPETLRKKLRPDGGAEATLIVTRVSGRATVLVAHPLPS
ncbi:class I SAM-dependent methyltransferase [Phytoactinopolyspora endophytica]|uniref:class I SAM-dependent methyltransferase n=1 Tax=Phytoactinopolyspora endophytica TaxID=1642495 RepID=UPI00197C2FAA|nr:class I SAM-dependent methyltransferase [Phytoactinopolyspora endophytica]